MSIAKDLAYKTLDAVTFGRGVPRRIGGESIRFPAKWSRYYEAEYEPETFKFFRENLKRGDTVLDIGGHIGLFAVVAAKIVGPDGMVFSFEPTPLSRSVLKSVVDLNGVAETVEVRGEAVSSESGEMTFFDTGEDISNANSLVRSELSRHEIRVLATSVDEFARERNLQIDCLKIDVEGAEFDVLNGAKETFMTQRPVARLGLHPRFITQNGQTLANIWTVLSEYGYSVIYEGSSVDSDWFCSQTELFDVNLIPSK